MIKVQIHRATLKRIIDACYAAYEAGELSDEDYSDVMSTLRKGVPQDVLCEGRAFHRNPGHVCDPEEH